MPCAALPPSSERYRFLKNDRHMTGYQGGDLGPGCRTWFPELRGSSCFRIQGRRWQRTTWVRPKAVGLTLCLETFLPQCSVENERKISQQWEFEKKKNFEEHEAQRSHCSKGRWQKVKDRLGEWGMDLAWCISRYQRHTDRLNLYSNKTNCVLQKARRKTESSMKARAPQETGL